MDTTGCSGNADYEWAIQLNRFGLKIVGLWPQETVNSKEKLRSNIRLFTVIVAIVCVFTIPLLHSLIKIWGDLTAMMDNMMFSIPISILPVKMLIMWWKKESEQSLRDSRDIALTPLLITIANDWIKPKSSKERDVMVRHARRARLIILCSYILTMTTIAALLVVSAFGYSLRFATNETIDSRPLPVQAHYMYDTSVSPQYEITFFIQCIICVVFALPFLGIDNFLGLVLFHICGQLENLSGRLHQMRRSRNFRTALKINVTDHIRLVRSVTIVENTFTLMLLLIFLHFGTLTCIYGFQFVTIVVEEKKVSIKATFLIMVICTSFIHMCVYCAVGELLVTKYEKVYNAIYEYEWYTLETTKAKNLILLMVRMNKPLYITVGKVLPMTMSSFCNILKTSGGYISVLLANRS